MEVLRSAAMMMPPSYWTATRVVWVRRGAYSGGDLAVVVGGLSEIWLGGLGCD